MIVGAAVGMAACSQQRMVPEQGATRPAGEARAYVHRHPAEVALWTDGVPGQMANGGPEVVNWRDEIEPTSPAGVGLHFPVVTNIHNPSVTPYLPPQGQATGCALIIAPGGGHMFLSINHEGYDVAQLFANCGVTCFVLKYRLARAPGSTYTIDRDALADARRAVRFVRAHAGEYHIDPERVGFLGFSAGGELATLLVNKPEAGAPDAKDAIDRESAALNFQCLLYPGRAGDVGTVGGVTIPPTFMAASYDDRPDISQGLAQAYLRLKQAHVPAELHLYNAGGHGFGVRWRDIEETEWPAALLAFMRDRGFWEKGHSAPVNLAAGGVR
ncbi:MAG TPA: alpha/beta hydrolase [Phycisphaerae bacterium]|nr:alpha/beta hydrolase [Phycisphaerae bacterium]